MSTSMDSDRLSLIWRSSSNDITYLGTVKWKCFHSDSIKGMQRLPDYEKLFKVLFTIKYCLYEDFCIKQSEGHDLNSSCGMSAARCETKQSRL